MPGRTHKKQVSSFMGRSLKEIAKTGDGIWKINEFRVPGKGWSGEGSNCRKIGRLRMALDSGGTKKKYIYRQ